MSKSRMTPPASAVAKESTITPKKSNPARIAADAPSTAKTNVPPKSAICTRRGERAAADAFMMKDYKVWAPMRGARFPCLAKTGDPSTSLKAGYGAPAAGRDSHSKAPPCRKRRDKDGDPMDMLLG